MTRAGAKGMTASLQWGNQLNECAYGDIDMADHEHGKMDINTQKKTFDGFIRWVAWGAGISIGVLIFMALVNG